MKLFLKGNSHATVSLIILLLLSTLAVVVPATKDTNIIAITHSKKKNSTSSYHITTRSNIITGIAKTIQASHDNHSHHNLNLNPDVNSLTYTTTSSPLPQSILSLSSSEKPSDVPAPSLVDQQATVQSLYRASAIATANATGDLTKFSSQMNQQQRHQHLSCLDSASTIDKFILPLKEARFTHIRPCVTVTGTVISGQKINADGDISFNIAVDQPYQGMLGPGNLDASRVTLSGEHGLRIEVICQEPVISSMSMDVRACNGYNGPDFHSSLPIDHEHVMVTGRFQIEWNEAPGGLTEIHPVYAIKTIPKR